MNNQQSQTVGQLPGYITSAVPNPKDKRAPWYKNTAPTYAGIFLWFVFWQDAANANRAKSQVNCRNFSVDTSAPNPSIASQCLPSVWSQAA